MRRLLGCIGLLATMRMSLAAQGVMVAPHAVFMDHRTRSGSVVLFNPGTQPVEVEISTLFGYLVTDSSGAIQLRTVDTPDSTLPSALGWIQAFPRRLRLAPRERQTVRLLARPPADLVDGEYWVRLVIAAQAGMVPVSGVVDTAAIQVGLQLHVRTIIGVNYRKGAVTTGVTLSHLRAQIVGDSLISRAKLERLGNALFIGTIRQTLVDAQGGLIAFAESDSVRKAYDSPVSVYFTLEPRLSAAVLPPHLAPGRYWLRYEVVTEREDLDPVVVLKAPAVRDSVQVVVP